MRGTRPPSMRFCAAPVDFGAASPTRSRYPPSATRPRRRASGPSSGSARSSAGESSSAAEVTGSVLLGGPDARKRPLALDRGPAALPAERDPLEPRDLALALAAGGVVGRQ